MADDLHELIKKAKKGDQESFRQLITSYKGNVYRHAYVLLNDRMEAEDVTQEAFIKVYYSLAKLENEFAFVSWLTRIVTNLCYDKNKMKKKAFFPEELNENINVQKGSNPIEQSLTKMNIKEAMQKLPMEQRNVLVLREIQGYSYSEISSMLKIPLGTVKSRINTARENLRKELQMG